MTEAKYKQPEWYDPKKLIRVTYGEFDDHTGETGWAIDLGDGTCRLANDPICISANWGDRVELSGRRVGKVLEQYDPEVDRIE